VARKLSKIEEEIQSKTVQFDKYFYSNLNNNVRYFIDKLNTKTKIYLFSGIIRDFFIKTKKDTFRDIDIIIEDDIAIELLFENIKYEKNSFGGYKILIDSINIDLWVIRKTWALNNGQLKLEFDYINELPKTTFFNFSSIIYSLQDKKFIIGKDFLRFLRDKEIDIVSQSNPYPELCIVNSFYYSDKLNIKLAKKLRIYIINNYVNNIDKCEVIQIKHFNEIKYTKRVLMEKITKLI
jgi:hypothetical protein